jgi:hypothetical protein
VGLEGCALSIVARHLLTDGHLNQGIVEPENVEALTRSGLSKDAIRTSCLGSDLRIALLCSHEQPYLVHRLAQKIEPWAQTIVAGTATNGRNNEMCWWYDEPSLASRADE